MYEYRDGCGREEGTEFISFRNSSVRKMMNNNFEIRTMTIEDYQGVHDLWMTIKGFAIRSIDDSKEGVASFLKRNPTKIGRASCRERVCDTV